MTDAQPRDDSVGDAAPMRVLVAIAYYGTANREYLLQLLDAYQAMTYDVDIVILTEAAKGLDGVEEIIGLPIEDPYSLPFAHKQLFLDRRDDYDLFIYSEDDTLVGQDAIEAFLWATDMLPDDKIAGFLRTEESPDGSLRCSSVHNHFHWTPDSVSSIGGELWGHFSNPHGAVFMLTREQLARQIDGGCFDRPARLGRYSMRVTAATDPYTQCGAEKVLCLSRMDDFLLPHLSNRYLNTLGLSLEEFLRQAERLGETVTGDVDTRRLFHPTVDLDDNRWDKRFYGAPRDGVLDAVPRRATRVLSLGMGSGDAEAQLMERGHEVVGIPLDDIIAGLAQSRGIETTAPDLDDAIAALSDRRFDAVLAINTLPFFERPVDVVKRLAALVEPGGTIVATAPNTRNLRIRARFGKNPQPIPSDGFAGVGVHPASPGDVKRWLRDAGCAAVQLRFTESSRPPAPAALLGADVIATATMGSSS